ncbi:MAG: hypothetical protein EWV41_16820 [Microcystis wesenbergii Mw_MB_S_20031200_S109]|jgi:hypothetical protein|uniref:Uncharacterized protein n=1 Tax=Microcystis wesenbergii Mw_MB_S_20031200_S109D TaxID=2486241 RepID=A0A552M523_9CHRO|nr:hypothetical protein [Microcystis aeruginosa]TRV04962.1 MAG: hypothetical protein EWV41_16820 [Microcystis wesenbergii Mw_MB_S_20031200_S109]TRV27575.1 MAG: hypothetical protein EWV88_04585 [Microcystis wesenbergii Mw_MB_S_20031200_S109D]
MIEILKETHDRQNNEVNSYVTVKFLGYHEVFQQIETIKTYRLPNNQSKDDFLQQEYDNWFSCFDNDLEF